MSVSLKRPIDRICYRAPEAAAAIGVSVTVFREWVDKGLLPKPFRVGRVTLYSARSLELAIMAIEDAETGAVDSTNPYDES